jgi:hypothetical protein
VQGNPADTLEADEQHQADSGAGVPWGTSRFRAETLAGMESVSMAKGDPEDLAALAAKRAEFRLHHVGTKLNERELRELEALLEEREVTQGEFIRGLILAEIERDRTGVRASAELVEIMACKLLLVNFLRPLAVGKPLSAETFDSYIGEVRKYKAEAAEKALKEHAERP